MHLLRETIDKTNAALRRLSRAGASDEEAAAAAKEIREHHLPALDAEDEHIARATRETLGWMERERARHKERLAALAY